MCSLLFTNKNIGAYSCYLEDGTFCHITKFEEVVTVTKKKDGYSYVISPLDNRKVIHHYKLMTRINSSEDLVKYLKYKKTT